MCACDWPFPNAQNFFGRPDTGVKNDARDGCQVLDLFIEGRKEALFFVHSVLIELPLPGISIGSWRRARQPKNGSGKQQRVGKVVDPLHLDCGTRVG